jgi:predicted Rossmann fold nucleotide-binding protein DprA/Smf involved in DNA uptake
VKILRGKSNRDILPSNFIHNIDILKTMAKQPLFMSVYLLLRNNVLYHIDDRAVSELTAEKIAEILGYDLVVICGILLELEVAGWIKKHAAGYSLGTVQMTAVGGKIQ